MRKQYSVQLRYRKGPTCTVTVWADTVHEARRQAILEAYRSGWDERVRGSMIQEVKESESEQ